MGEDAGAGYDHGPVVVCKGKRSKRQRLHAVPPPPPPEMVIAAGGESSSSAVDDGWRGGGAGHGAEEEEAASGRVTEEDRNMARLLMLLARDARSGPSPLVAAAKDCKFECKTCGRCFQSFQALGGHRTSHKKPRLVPTRDEKTRSPPAVAVVNTPTPLSPAADPTVLAIPAAPPMHEAATGIGGSKQQQGRVHECGVCGSEFASGQALGGHMRRHRPLVPASLGVVASGGKETSLLELDLNMPAPCDDAADTASPVIGVKEMSPAPATILFPEPLVDCRY